MTVFIPPVAPSSIAAERFCPSHDTLGRETLAAMFFCSSRFSRLGRETFAGRYPAPRRQPANLARVRRRKELARSMKEWGRVGQFFNFRLVFIPPTKQKP
ncbi:MAG TPA: hypothetical protein VNI36_01185 [Candidatus Dormibacteraeota bacterium]|nr:hypothetical protein [Candidatus Dormibacteraeota bacterium]